MIDIIAPADAFRLLFCAHYGRQRWRTAERVAKRITSYEWWRKSSWHARTTVQTAASEVLRKFEEHMKKGNVRLHGSLTRRDSLTGGESRDPPVEIPQVDCRDGDLDIFRQILKIYRSPQTFGTAYTYTRVYCVRADTLKLIDSNVKTSAADEAPQKGRAGAPEKYDWDALKELFFSLWKAHGDYRRPENKKPGWNSQAAAAKKLLENINLEDEKPDQKVLERHIKVWIEGIPSRGT